MTCSSSSRRLVRAALVGMVGLTLGVACSGESGPGMTNTGDGGPAGVHITTSPSTFTFGDVLIGVQSDPTTITVKNDGTDASTPLAISASAGFKITTNGCTTGLAGNGGTCTVAVAFIPDAPGPKGGTLDVSYGSVKVTTTLTGNGVK